MKFDLNGLTEEDLIDLNHKIVERLLGQPIDIKLHLQHSLGPEAASSRRGCHWLFICFTQHF